MGWVPHTSVPPGWVVCPASCGGCGETGTPGLLTPPRLPRGIPIVSGSLIGGFLPPDPTSYRGGGTAGRRAGDTPGLRAAGITE